MDEYVEYGQIFLILQRPRLNDDTVEKTAIYNVSSGKATSQRTP